jgi:hypothetical protein
MGEHLIRPPADPEGIQALTQEIPSLPEDLVDLYRLADGLSLPDVHVGYFVHPVAAVIRGAASGEPRSLEGMDHAQVLVFGSDGGGGRFALRLDTGAVLHLSSSGAVQTGVFDAVRHPPRVVAKDLAGFLDRLAEDVDAFIEGKDSWSFMAT